jgi:hypothetical protein
MQAVRLRVLRPFQELLGVVVRNVDLRQPDQEPNLSAATFSDALDAAIQLTRVEDERQAPRLFR